MVYLEVKQIRLVIIVAKTRDSFADRVRILREEQALSATDLARLADVTPAAVWNWEKNGTTPRLATLHTLASKLGVTAAYLLNGGKIEAPLPTAPTMVADAATIAPDIALEDVSLEKLIRAIEIKGFTVTVTSKN